MIDQMAISGTARYNQAKPQAISATLGAVGPAACPGPQAYQLAANGYHLGNHAVDGNRPLRVFPVVDALRIKRKRPGRWRRRRKERLEKCRVDTHAVTNTHAFTAESVRRQEILGYFSLSGESLSNTFRTNGSFDLSPYDYLVLIATAT